jgi:hypothetical protein
MVFAYIAQVKTTSSVIAQLQPPLLHVPLAADHFTFLAHFVLARFDFAPLHCFSFRL